MNADTKPSNGLGQPMSIRKFKTIVISILFSVLIISLGAQFYFGFQYRARAGKPQPELGYIHESMFQGTTIYVSDAEFRRMNFLRWLSFSIIPIVFIFDRIITKYGHNYWKNNVQDIG